MPDYMQHQWYLFHAVSRNPWQNNTLYAWRKIFRDPADRQNSVIVTQCFWARKKSKEGSGGECSLYLGGCLEWDVNRWSVGDVFVHTDVTRRSTRSTRDCWKTLPTDHTMVQRRLSCGETEVALPWANLPSHQAVSRSNQVDWSASIGPAGLSAGSGRILADAYHEQLRKCQKALELSVIRNG